MISAKERELQTADMVQRIFARIFGLCIALSLIVFGHHRSADSQFFNGWSRGYSVTILLLVVLFFIETRIAASASARVYLGRMPALLRWPISLAGLLVCLLFFSGELATPDGAFSFHALTITPLIILLTLNQLWIFNLKHSGPLLVNFVLLLIVLALICVELPFVAGRRMTYVQAVWGDALTFRFLHPKREPFTGPGGRLAPERKLLLPTLEGDMYRGVEFQTNRWGFRNAEDFDKQISSGELRILNLGDSFALGSSVAQSDTYGAKIQETLQQKIPGRKVLVMNAEVSEPIEGLWYLDHHGKDFQPQIVLYTLFGGNDLMQTYLLSGFDGSVFKLPEQGGYSVNPDYDLSAIDRAAAARIWDYTGLPSTTNAIDTSNSVFQKIWLRDLIRFKVFSAPLSAWMNFRMRGQEVHLPAPHNPPLIPGTFFDLRADLKLFSREQSVQLRPLFELTFRALKQMKDLTEQSGARFVLVYVPLRLQVQSKDWELMLKEWRLDPAAFDLELPNKTVRSLAELHQIVLIDPTEDFRTAARHEELYLPYDMHWNTAGHHIAAANVAEALATRLVQ